MTTATTSYKWVNDELLLDRNHRHRRKAPKSFGNDLSPSIGQVDAGGHPQPFAGNRSQLRAHVADMGPQHLANYWPKQNTSAVYKQIENV